MEVTYKRDREEAGAKGSGRGRGRKVRGLRGRRGRMEREGREEGVGSGRRVMESGIGRRRGKRTGR